MKMKHHEEKNIHCGSGNLFLMHLGQSLQRLLDINHQAIAPGPRKILSHHHPHQFQFFAMRRHRIRWHHPPALTEVMSHVELVKVQLLFFRVVQAKRHERETFALTLTHDDEPQLGQAGREVIRRPGQIGHDELEPSLSQTDQLVVLTDDLRSTFGEVQGKRSLVGAEVVDVENQFLGKEFRRAPNAPAYAGVYLERGSVAASFTCP